MTRFSPTHCKTSLRTRAAIGACLVGALAAAAFAAPTVVTFQILTGRVIPREPFAARITMIGSAIQNGPGGYHIPVTMQVQLRTAAGVTTTIEPFGRYDQALNGNVNPMVAGSTLTGRPLRHTIRGMNPANMAITVTGRSWRLKDDDLSGSVNSDWEPLQTRNSQADPSLVKVLRNGDPVPAIAGWLGQNSVEYYLRQYVDSSTRTMRLGVNEAIYLFELGTSSTSSGAYDLQDLVVLVTLAETPIELDDQAD